MARLCSDVSHVWKIQEKVHSPGGEKIVELVQRAEIYITVRRRKTLKRYSRHGESQNSDKITGVDSVLCFVKILAVEGAAPPPIEGELRKGQLNQSNNENPWALEGASVSRKHYGWKARNSHKSKQNGR